MTGGEHYAKAENFAAMAETHLTEDPADMRIAEIAMGISQAHATLALAAATELASDSSMWPSFSGYGR